MSGCGFALYDNIFTSKDIDDANATLKTFVDRELSKELSKVCENKITTSKKNVVMGNESPLLR